MPDAPPESFLRTQRLHFRHWSEADAALAMSLWGDPEVTRLFGGPFSASQVHERLAREIAQQATDGVQYWPIFLLEFEAFVGCCGLRPYPQGEHVFEIGFHLVPLTGDWVWRRKPRARQSTMRSMCLMRPACLRDIIRTTRRLRGC